MNSAAGAVSPAHSSFRATGLPTLFSRRARFGELVQNRAEHGSADLFLVGLLSLKDAILQIPMSLVIDGLPMDAYSIAMLVDNAGPLLPMYRLIWALE
jgi:c-di-GMP-related signal transduction protein